MPSIQVKDVPEEVHAVLRRRGPAAGQSLQEYLLARLREEAETPTLDELLSGSSSGPAVVWESRRQLVSSARSVTAIDRGRRQRPRHRLER